MRLSAMSLVLLVVLGALESALRLIGYGYPTSYFLRSSIDGRDYFVPNARFGLRFFPPALARTPLPLRMAAEKSTNSYRIFLFGESAAQGDPDPTFGFGRYLEVLLRDRFPGTDFEVVCVAMTAINSHVILPIARECARRQGDLWLVYMGNNEMVGPFGAGTVFGPQAPGLALIRASLALKTTKTGQWLDRVIGNLHRGASGRKSWGGMKMFTEHQLRYDDASRLRVYGHFQRNLEDILRAGAAAGAPVILSTVASNLKDCGPFGSLHAATLDETQRAAWDNAFQAGQALEASGACQSALGFYAQAAQIDPQLAELQFRLGTCHLAMSNLDQARRDFELARDYDALAFRADTRLNQIIKETAGRHTGRGVYSLDAAEVLAQHSRQGIPGQELFYEHVHLNFEGNYLLARAFAETAARLLPSTIAARDKGAWASGETCDLRLAATIWDRRRLWSNNFRRLFEPPFTSQPDHALRVKVYQAKLDDITARMNAETPEMSRDIYKKALAAAPQDYYLHGNFSEFLDAIDDLPQAIAEQERVRELLPGEPVPYYKIGRFLLRQGKFDEALDSVSRALAISADFPQALNEKGLLLANRQKTAEAAACFTRALRANPDYSETYVNLGFMEQTQGNLAQALGRYEEAARLEVQGPAAFFYQGVGQAAQHQRNDAIESFRQAIQLRPGFWQANYLLGVELAAQDKVEEARAQFAETVRCRPDYARAHVNLGVALAKQGKLDSALGEFQTALHLNPANKLAQQHIAMIQTLKNRGH